MSNPYLGANGLTKLKCLHELLRIFNMVIYLVNIQEERDKIYIGITAHYSKLCRGKCSSLIPQRYCHNLL